MRKRTHRKVRQASHIVLPDKIAKLVLPLHTALTLIPLGMFSRENANEIAKIVNVVIVDSDERNDAVNQTAINVGNVLANMFKRVRSGSNWGATTEELRILKHGIVVMDRYLRTITVRRYDLAVAIVNAINNEAKAKGYGFLDTMPVRNSDGCV